METWFRPHKMIMASMMPSFLDILSVPKTPALNHDVVGGNDPRYDVLGKYGSDRAARRLRKQGARPRAGRLWF